LLKFKAVIKITVGIMNTRVVTLELFLVCYLIKHFILTVNSSSYCGEL